MDFGEYLKAALEIKNISQKALSERLGISAVYVNKLCNGSKTPSLELLERICSALDFSLSEFFSCRADGTPMLLHKSEVAMLLHFRGMREHEQRAISDLISALHGEQKSTRLSFARQSRDVEGIAAAGSPLFEKVSDESIPVPDKYLDNERYYIVKTRGVSMEPKIPAGSYAIVQIDVQPEQGQLAVVGVEGVGEDPEYLLKEVHYLPGNEIELRSYNPQFPPKKYSLSDVFSIERVDHVIKPQELNKNE